MARSSAAAARVPTDTMGFGAGRSNAHVPRRRHQAAPHATDAITDVASGAAKKNAAHSPADIAKNAAITSDKRRTSAGLSAVEFESSQHITIIVVSAADKYQPSPR